MGVLEVWYVTWFWKNIVYIMIVSQYIYHIDKPHGF